MKQNRSMQKLQEGFSNYERRPGRDAPLASVTVPEMLPVSACALHDRRLATTKLGQNFICFPM